MDLVTNPLATIILGSEAMTSLCLQSRDILLHEIYIQGANTIYDCLYG
jgi:hypothetical protein